VDLLLAREHRRNVAVVVGLNRLRLLVVAGNPGAYLGQHDFPAHQSGRLFVCGVPADFQLQPATRKWEANISEAVTR
jgi:hypothetical protein